MYTAILHKMFFIDPIYVGNTILPVVDVAKFLGVYIDSHLSWTEHVTFVGNKLAQCYSMLRVCRSLCLPTSVCVMLYNAFALPYLMYGIECWGNTANTNINSLYVWQKKIVRCSLYGS